MAEIGQNYLKKSSFAGPHFDYAVNQGVLLVGDLIFSRVIASKPAQHTIMHQNRLSVAVKWNCCPDAVASVFSKILFCSFVQGSPNLIPHLKILDLNHKDPSNTLAALGKRLLSLAPVLAADGNRSTGLLNHLYFCTRQGVTPGSRNCLFT